MEMHTVKDALQSGGKLNRLKSLWRVGRTALGAIATIPSVQTVQIMARSGLNWIHDFSPLPHSSPRHSGIRPAPRAYRRCLPACRDRAYSISCCDIGWRARSWLGRVSLELLTE